MGAISYTQCCRGNVSSLCHTTFSHLRPKTILWDKLFPPLKKNYSSTNTTCVPTKRASLSGASLHLFLYSEKHAPILWANLFVRKTLPYHTPFLRRRCGEKTTPSAAFGGRIYWRPPRVRTSKKRRAFLLVRHKKTLLRRSKKQRSYCFSDTNSSPPMTKHDGVLPDHHLPHKSEGSHNPPHLPSAGRRAQT